MSQILNRRSFGLGVASAIAVTSYARADSHGPNVVRMLNVDPENSRIRNVFTPRLLVVDPGTNVLFEATDRGHNSASVDGMIPDGAEPWKGRIGADIEIQFSIPGFYGYVCTPHVPLGMVGLIVVQGDGMLDNLDAARAVRHRGKAGPVFEEIWAEVDELGLTSA